MKKKIFMSAAKKARIALAVMAVCGFTLAGAQSAFAENVTIDQDKNIICGDGATATKNPNSTEEGTGMIVIGNSAAATGLDSIAIGTNTVATGDRTTVVGGQAKADGGGVAIGYLSDASGTFDAVAVGYRTKASGRYSTAIGKEAAAEGVDSLAIAYSAKALAKNSVALGYQAKSASENSIALGYRSSAESEGSFAIGSNSKVTGVNSVAIGTGSEAKRDNSVSVGSGKSDYYGPIYRQIINVADGTADNDAATYGQILKKGNYTISLDATGNGQAVLKTNAGNDGPTIKVDASELSNKITAVDNKIGSLSTDGTYIKKANNVSANLVELDKQVNTNAIAITNKANLDLSNINAAGETKIKNLAGNKAGEVVDAKLGDITSENYVKKDDTVNANISALDKQVKANADAINTKADKDLSNITDAGKNVIKDLAGNKAGEVVDAKLGDITSENYVKKDDTVNANISALDKQMKANADDIITANNKITNVDNKIGDLAKLDTAEKGNLVGAVNEVNKKADKNADDIKTVNGRVDELGGRVDTLGGAVSKLDTKVNKVGAGAAALAALHPMDFDPDNKLTFAAGVGNYCGANAAAIGAFYRPNEQVMFSIAGNMGNGENMVNAGVSFALDRPSQTPTTKAALVKTVAAQNEQIAALNETVAEQNEKIARLEAMVEKLVAKQNA